MFVNKILLKNYRNLKETLLELNKNLNILVGYNGQGKTNFLESIYLLGTGSSHRTVNDKELINWHKDKALVQVLLEKKIQSLKITLLLENNGKKIEINNTLACKISELIGNLNVVLFSPEDLDLIKGGPAKRRKFLDVEVSQVSAYYFHILQKYNHVLKQRNILLKNIREGKGDKDYLELWDEELVKLGCKIIRKRIEAIDKLKILARLTQRQITNGSENLIIYYDSSLVERINKDEDLDFIFRQKLVNNRQKEIKFGYTIFGPHRDDLIFKVNDIDLRRYGSQGQQRTTALALKLAELEFMKSEMGEYPILLLDDVFSELDERRRNTLINLIADKIQTFITTTDINSLGNIKEESYQIFKVSEGMIEKER